MPTRFILLCLLLLLQPGIFAQTSGNIRASATVVEATDILLIPMKDMVIDETSARDGILDISPITDVKAGKILVKGRSNSSVRLSYLNEMSLVNTTGEGTVVCKYVISGFKSDNQAASQLLDQVERIVQFSEKGEFYLWLGGKVNLSRARPGNYDGEFTIQIEYI
ncbi:MAG: DUF4402 domain-containing protein [bacterium]